MLSIYFDPAVQNPAEFIAALREIGTALASFGGAPSTVDSFTRVPGMAPPPFPPIVDPAKVAAQLASGQPMKMADVLAATGGESWPPTLPDDLQQKGALEKPAKPAKTEAAAPAPAPAVEATAPAAGSAAPPAAPSIDYPTLQKAVAELFKLNPQLAAKIPTDLGHESYKVLPPAKWAEALALVKDAMAAAKAAPVAEVA